MDLCRELGVHRRTMVRSHDGISCIEKRIHDSAEIRHVLGVVREPRTSINMDSDRVSLFLHLRDIYVKLVIDLIITDIIDIRELLGTMHIYLRHLPASETSGRLRLKRKRAHQE